MKTYTPMISKKTNSVMSVSFLLILMTVLPQTLQAAVIPESTRLASLSYGMSDPVAVAIDQAGRLYVVEHNRNELTILSQSGKHIHTIEGLAEPVNVAVALDGTIYIGNKGRGNVEIYGSAFQLQGKLGQGDGEFGDPHDIALDPADNNIYVVDRENHLVKKYSYYGEYLSSIGSPGNGDGEFHNPLSIAIDSATDEIIVLDCQEVYNLWFYTDKTLNGARVQFFEKNVDGDYVFDRGYDLFGTVLDSSDLMRPAHLTVDGESRVYVADASFEEVKVYDNQGEFLGMLNDDDAPLRTPIGLGLGATNQMYVVSQNGGRLDVFGLDNFTHLQVDRLAASFTVNYGVPQGRAQRLAITNGGTTDFDWTAESSAGWITLSTTGGFLTQSQSSGLDVNVQTGGLGIGEYTGTVTITAGGVISEVVDVTLRIVPNFELSVTPGTLAFETEVGATPMFEVLDIVNQGTGPIRWTAQADSDWLSLSGTFGTTPSDVRVFVDATSLTAGTYDGNIVITVHGIDSIGPVTIPVSLTLKKPQLPGPPPGPPPVITEWPGDHKMKWTVVHQLKGISLNSIWGNTGSDIYVAGAGGTIIHHDGSAWKSMVSGTAEGLHDVWGSSDTDVYAVGDNATILHYNGTGWSKMVPNIPDSIRSMLMLRSVWQTAGTEVYAAGNDGSILGSPSTLAWNLLSYSYVINIPDLRAIWGSSDANIFAVGESGTILRYDGSVWSAMISGTSETLHGIWGSTETDIFAVGTNGTILQYNGTSWSKADSGTSETLTDVWGIARNEIYAVGANGTMLRFDGTQWIPVSIGTEEYLNGVWSSKSLDIYAVSAEGSILHGFAKGFPWMLLQPALNYNAEQMRLRMQNQVQGKQ